MVKRTRLFKVISAILPFLAICLLELSLRACHYGRDLSLFIEYPNDPHYLVFNPDASKRYFTDEAMATKGNVEPFLKEKQMGTLRIFVLGESTTIGYPYFHNASFHRWLQYRLMRTFPGKPIEVINLSLTAVNSYTVLGFARELVNYSPDAVLIYTGHNEYYGAMGVGSTERMGNSPSMVHAVLWLRGMRTVQLLSRMVGGIISLAGGHKDNQGKTRMELMVKEEQIPFGSPLYERGIEQFQHNLQATLALLNERHIPTFVSNLVSNVKDMQPFISAPVDSLRYPAFSRNFADGVMALGAKDSAAASAAFMNAENAFPGHALCNYYLGRLAYGKGDDSAARVWLERAQDLDELRFRGPDTLNRIILALCRAYPNTHLVDTKSAFEAMSSGHLVGEELLLEHVHPNLSGYALMSDVFYRALEDADLFKAAPGLSLSYDQLRAIMPITKADSLVGVYKIWNLKSNWPFNQGIPQDSLKVETEEEELAFNMTFRHMPWSDAMSDLYDYYIKERDLRAASTVIGTLALEHPTEAAYYEKAGNVYGELKDYEQALYYFGEAFRREPSFDKAHVLFVIDLQLDRPEAALPYLDFAIQNNAANLSLGPLRAYTHQVIELRSAFSRDSTDLPLVTQIAQVYRKMGNADAAIKYETLASKLNNH